jgi:uncharacterized protein YjbI with pentapeptide repeats
VTELAGLAFAQALVPHRGGLAAGVTYDTVHFDQLELDTPSASGSRFLECAFTQVSFTGGQLRNAQFTQVWLRACRIVATGLAETGWVDATVIGGVLAGVEAFGARLSRVVLQGCKLDSVNFRDAALTDVTFDHCVLRDVDFGGASLTRTAFPGSKLSGTSFRQVTLDRADLRGAELGITVDPESLHGAIVSPAQLASMAQLLADSIGIIVEDPPPSIESIGELRSRCAASLGPQVVVCSHRGRKGVRDHRGACGPSRICR